MNFPVFLSSSLLVLTLSYPGRTCSKTATVPPNPAGQETPSQASTISFLPAALGLLGHR